jgi:organic hydroperoxide reductase OsmC/OhrA
MAKERAMAKYLATIDWTRGEDVYSDNKYSRRHSWSFDGGLSVPASPSPHIVPEPMSEPANVDPEEAFVAALSSCHMLFFLDFACQAGFVVDSYRDEAEGTMARVADRRYAMTHVRLHPRVTYSGTAPTRDEEEALHHRAHENCFIAISVSTVVETVLE